MRVIVCGGRNYSNLDEIYRTLEMLVGDEISGSDVTIVHGGARGADTLVGETARSLGMNVEEHKAEWDKYGNAAGPIRNQHMADLGADLLIAFPGGKGTASMISRAKRAGIDILNIAKGVKGV